MLTIIVPAHRADAAFERCLAALVPVASTTPVIVVDDGSPSAEVSRRAQALGFSTRRHEQSRGPSAARNLGAQAATTPLLLFVDADCVVRPDVATRVVAAFEARPGVDALFGSYDTDPAAPQFVSQFKNLTHHYTHQRAREEAFSFWAGCGAVRRERFLALGGFSERYGRPCIEDIEFGYRLRAAGGRIAVVKDLQVTHLKRWTLAGLVWTDVFDRGVPWTELILEHPGMTAGDLNLSAGPRSALMLTWLALDALFLSVWWPTLGWTAPLLLVAALVPGRRYFAWLAEVRGWAFAAKAVPLHLLYQLYSGVAALIGLGRHVLGLPTRR